MAAIEYQITVIVRPLRVPMRSINRLMADAPLREQMGRAGRARAVERFSWSAIADQTVELYRSLLGR